MASHTEVVQSGKTKWAQDVNIAGGNVTVDATGLEIGSVTLKDGVGNTIATVNASHELLVKETSIDACISASKVAVSQNALSSTTDSVTAKSSVATNLLCKATIDDSTPPKVDCNGSLIDCNSSHVDCNKSMIKLVDTAGTNVASVTSSNALKVDISATGANSTAIKVNGTGGDFPVSGTLTGITNAITANVTDNINNATFIKKTVDFTGSQTAQTIWTPTGGKKFVICDLSIFTSTGGAINLFDGSDSTTNRVIKVYLPSLSGVISNYTKPVVSSTADNVLKYTTDSTAVGSLTINGFEI